MKQAGLSKGRSMTQNLSVSITQIAARFLCAVAIVAVPGLAVRAAEIYWSGVQRAAQAIQPEQQGGEKAVLDALEKQARDTLARLNHPADREGWQKAIPELRLRLAAALGSEHLPRPQPRNLRQVGTIDRGDYVIEKLTYDTFPDCQVPALVYRLAKIEGKLPAILFAPGHSWGPSKATPDIQSFCITMARWGFVVLVYEPHGQGERGISFREHRRTELLLAGMCQQSIPWFESRCAMEYLLSRPDVDPQRIGMTGESGGGYNTWITTALEPRIAVAVPVVGTSEFFEQIQVCRGNDFYLAREHCHFVPGLLRFANNHEYVALAAPRPLLIIAADNDVSFPLPGIRQVVAYGRKLYGALDKPDQISYFEDAKTGHGYQKPKREAAYGWFRRWLQGKGSGEPIAEPAVQTVPVDSAELRCFANGRKEPAGPAVMAHLNTVVARLPAAGDPPPAEQLRTSVAEALGISSPQAEVKASRSRRRVEGGAVVERLEWDAPDGVRIPALLVAPPGQWRGAILTCADGGKTALLNHNAIRAAVESGLAVVLVDVRGTGELATSKPGWTFATSLLAGENFVGRQALDLVAGRRALAALPDFRGKPIGLFGSGRFASLAALYAAVLDPDAAWLATEGGFLSYRSFIERPRSLRSSYTLSATTDAAWDNIDAEVPASLFVFDVLRRFDLPDLYASLAPRPVLAAGAIDGDWQTPEPAQASKLLASGRFRWPKTPGLAVGEEATGKLRAFLIERAR
jgi:cephalosporin-C deacetylase-like acetyl esterase